MANPEHLKILKQGVEVWNRWRSENPEVRPDLEGSALQEINLRGVNLQAADLQLTQLQMADLRSANLQNANLWNANLSNSWLRRTNLVGAKFQHSTLDGTDFSIAQFALTLFINVDLSRAVGLSTSHHAFRSEVSVSSLEETARSLEGDASRGGEIEQFLRNAGVSEDYVEFFRLRIGSPIQFYSAFISYSHADKPFARRLHDQLQARGIRCWLDEHDLKPGDRILDVVNDAIRLHDKILLCCSESSLNSWWVKDEIRKALERERRDGRDIIIPLMVDRFLLDGWEDGMAANLRSRLAADFTGWEPDNAKFEGQFERVVKALRMNEGAREKVPKVKL